MFLEVAAAFYLLYRGHPWPAALVCGLATATRPAGLALAPVVFFWYLQHSPVPSWPRKLAVAVVVGLVAVSGYVLYHLYLWHLYGRPDAYFDVLQHWAPAQYRPWYRTVTFYSVGNMAVRPIRYTLHGNVQMLLHAKTWTTLMGVWVRDFTSGSSPTGSGCGGRPGRAQAVGHFRAR